jgi:DNA polymerase-1
MLYLTFTDPPQQSYPICLLAPQLNKSAMEQAYIFPFAGILERDMIAIDLFHTGKKTPVAMMKQYIEDELVPEWTALGVEYLLVADAEYFKTLTKSAKVEPHLGYVLDCVFGPWKVVYVPNFRSIFYDPAKVKSKIALAIEAIVQHRSGNYQAPGATIIRFAAYPNTVEEIEQWLERLIVEDRPLTCDTENFSLKHHTAGIGTISFAWSKHEGIAFPVDYCGVDPTRVRALLVSFFRRFRQKIIYHSIAYDAYVLIYQLFMRDILDTQGLLTGLDVMLKDWDDTKLIAYLATNSCAGNQLGLKVLAQEFSGNWAQDDIKDITKIPLPVLLEYNLIDALSTWYVHDKYYPIMVADQQLDIYQNLFQPATVDIIQMQLTGMPLNMKRVAEVKVILQAAMDKARLELSQSPVMHRYLQILRQKHVDDRNAKLKKKQITLTDPETLAVEFNPNSGPQLQDLVYGMLGLPVIALTKSRQPSTKGEVLKDLKVHTQDPVVKAFLETMGDYKSVAKILEAFIPAMENAALGPDGWHYLFGNFNLGGTLSGRLSSSNPNLQNLPANSKWAKLIKSCFQAPPGWLFCGLDFASLEDKISGLTTKDPNKLKVYTDGYDGHSLRAFAYFNDQMPDIRQAQPGKRTFTVDQGGKTFTLMEGDPVQRPDGSTCSIEELLP